MKEDMRFVMFGNQVQGAGIFDELPTYEEWIVPFEQDNPEPNMFRMQVYYFGKLPVWINGNAYFNSAHSWKNEKEEYINTEEKVYTLVLIEQFGGGSAG